MYIKNKKIPIYLEVLLVAFGTYITAFALNKFIIPVGLLSGGVTGISQILNHYTEVSVALFYFLLNIPLMILGHKELGKKFSIYTIFSIVFMSVCLYLVPVEALFTDDILLSGLFGGVISAIGGGIVLRVGGSQGGLDILSRVIAKYKNISIGKVNLIINACIVIISGFIYGSEIALYTIISIFVGMKTYEIILNHVNRITLLIITDKGEEINTAITTQMHRGTTMWDAHGGYTHNEKTVLFCVLMQGELSRVKEIVKKTDEKAFVTLISTKSTIGQFHQIW